MHKNHQYLRDGRCYFCGVVKTTDPKLEPVKTTETREPSKPSISIKTNDPVKTIDVRAMYSASPVKTNDPKRFGIWNGRAHPLKGAGDKSYCGYDFLADPEYSTQDIIDRGLTLCPLCADIVTALALVPSGQ